MKYGIIIAVLLLSAGVYALPTSGTNILVSMAKYDPAPAEAGRFVTVWFDVLNRGSDIAENFTFSLTPMYPFSLPDNDPAKTISIPSSSSVRIEYRLFVDRDAPDTKGELKLVSKISSAAVAEWAFNVTIDNTLEDADLKALFVSARPTPYAGGSFNISVDVVNANKGTAYYVRAKVESPVASIGRNEIFIGTLEPNDYDNLDFELNVMPNTPAGTYPLNITFAYRDKDSKLFVENDVVNFRVSAQGDMPVSESVPAWMYIVNIVVILILIRLAIPFGKWFLKPFRRKNKPVK
jgi:hypothetical protein